MRNNLFDFGDNLNLKTFSPFDVENQLNVIDWSRVSITCLYRVVC